MASDTHRTTPQPPSTAASGTRRSLWRLASKYGRALSAFGFFVVMIVAFSIANPSVLLNPALWAAVFVSLPMSIILAVALVFVIAAGEIDLSFGAVVGMAGWAFALVIQAGGSPILGLLAAIGAGAACGLFNGLLVTRVRISSLVATLGMNFLLRGLINIGNQGFGIPLTSALGTPFQQALTGKAFGVPVQMFWGIAFAIVAWFIFNRHQFGVHVRCVGDNPGSAREMGIDVPRVKTLTFIYVGLAAAFVGVLNGLVNMTFYPTAGDGYLLSVLSAVFVGGTPTWGGVGTITGAVIGASVVGWIETGVIAVGLTGFYTQFFYGLIIVLSLISHRFNRSKFRY
jgi:ribose/xylose/arabinose/galactoside ABC-type transport system permease subunit